MRRISRTQQEVLDLMAKDWELGSSGIFDPRYWLQKGGLGKGGEMKDISSATFRSLESRGLVELSLRKHPFTYYRLTEKGKEAVNR